MNSHGETPPADHAIPARQEMRPTDVDSPEPMWLRAEVEAEVAAHRAQAAEPSYADPTDTSLVDGVDTSNPPTTETGATNP